MKYPESFKMIDKQSGRVCEVEYDAANNVYLQDYLDGGYVALRTESDIEALEEAYNIVPNYPDQLSFYHDTTTQQYNLVRIRHLNMWACYQEGDDERLPSGATYTAEEIAEHFAKGHWREVSFAEEATKERELVFPIVYKSIHEDCAYKIVKDDDGVLWWHCQRSDWVSTIPDLYSHEHVANRIKDGDWRVISVGEQAEAKQKLVDTPPSPSTSVSELTINVNADSAVEAAERLERLAEAAERANIALESFGSLMADLQGLFSGGQGGCVAFCCEEG